MKIKVITPEFSVASQLSLDDLPQVQQLGYKAIICNRPDGEAPEQTPFASIKREVESLGMSCCYLPVESGQLVTQNAEDLQQSLQELPAPVLAYCRSGSRSANLWKLMADHNGEH